MSEMVERVAQAIAEKTMLVSKIEREDGTFSVMVLRSEAEMIARAAIAAMREPRKFQFAPDIEDIVWNRKIDEALK